MASFQLFSLHGSGHWATPILLPQKKRQEKKRERGSEGATGGGGVDGKLGRRTEERVGIVQTNGEKGCFLLS